MKYCRLELVSTAKVVRLEDEKDRFAATEFTHLGADWLRARQRKKSRRQMLRFLAGKSEMTAAI